MKIKLKPYKIVLLYAVLSAAWILFSDRAAAYLFSGTPNILLMVNTLKGWFYVCVISALLYCMLKRFEAYSISQGKLLNEREARLGLFLDNAGDAIYLARLDGHLVDANTEAEHQTGYSREEILSMTVLDVDADATPESYASFVRTIRDTKQVSYESTHRRKDGSSFPVDLRIAYLDAGDGEYVIGIARDISERKLSEKHLQQTTMMLSNIINTVSQSIFWKDTNSVYLGCNKAFARDAGLSAPEDIIGRSDFDLPWLPEETDAYRTDDKAVMQSREPKPHIIEQQLNADGTRRWLDTSKYPMQDTERNVWGVLGIYEDITERKRSEEALRQSEAKFRRLHESMMDGYVSFDLQGRILEYNTAFSAMLGYSRQELSTLTNEDLTPADWLEKEKEIIRDVVFKRGYSDLYEKEFRHKDGVLVPVELRSYLLGGQEGRLDGIWTIARDISERKRLQESMVQSEKMISVGGLAAGMAHEINNPLGGILQSAQVLVSRLQDDNPANLQEAEQAGCNFHGMSEYLRNRGIFDLLAAVRESAMRAALIVSNLLEFSRKSTSGYIKADVNIMLEKALTLASSDFDLKGKFDFRSILIKREFAANLPKVTCSPQEIEQVFFNILKNAAQALAAPREGWDTPVITLRTSQKGAQVVIEVADNGPGMNADVAKRVFEPFFTTKETGQGTGLGLAVSYFIVATHHGGQITLETSPGKGARFSVELPV